MAKPPPLPGASTRRPAAHVQAALRAIQPKALISPGACSLRPPAAHVAAMAAQARSQGAPAVQAHPAALPRGVPRRGVIQRSSLEEKKKSNSSQSSVSKGSVFVRQEDNYKASGTYVNMGEGKDNIQFAALHTDKVRPCFVLCMFGGSQIVAPIYMHHTPFADDLLNAGLKTAKKWSSEKTMGFEGITSYIIGGDLTQQFDKNKLSGFEELNVVDILSPLSQDDNDFGCVEMKGGKINYWFEHKE